MAYYQLLPVTIGDRDDPITENSCLNVYLCRVQKKWCDVDRKENLIFWGNLLVNIIFFVILPNIFTLIATKEIVTNIVIILGMSLGPLFTLIIFDMINVIGLNVTIGLDQGHCPENIIDVRTLRDFFHFVIFLKVMSQLFGFAMSIAVFLQNPESFILIKDQILLVLLCNLYIVFSIAINLIILMILGLRKLIRNCC